MRRSLVLCGALASAAFGPYPLSGAHAGPAIANQNEPCASLVKTLEAQIETIKLLTRHPQAGLQNLPKQKIKDHGKHGLDVNVDFPDNARAVTEARQAAAREREQADSLNGMLPGFGCSALDIDAELKKPENPKLLPESATAKKKSH
jgi:hypothetical protein